MNKNTLTLREAQANFEERRRKLAMTRIELANAESQYELALTAFLALLSSRSRYLGMPTGQLPT